MKKILFMINSMGVGGAEKSLSSLLNLFDYQRYDVYLQMINRGGAFEKLLPPQVKILPPIPYFQFCGQPLVKQLIAGNARFLKARLAVSGQLRKNDRTGKPLHATQVLWNGARGAFDPLPGAYDVAVAWGQGTPTHFVAEKVSAAKKIAWVNVNYEAAGFDRNCDQEIYGKYDYISCVAAVGKIQGGFPGICRKSGNDLRHQQRKDHKEHGGGTGRTPAPARNGADNCGTVGKAEGVRYRD